MLQRTGHAQVHGPWWGALTWWMELTQTTARPPLIIFAQLCLSLNSTCNMTLRCKIGWCHTGKHSSCWGLHWGWELVALMRNEIFHSEECGLSYLWWVLPVLSITYCPAGLTYSPYCISGLNVCLLSSFFCCFLIRKVESKTRVLP